MNAHQRRTKRRADPDGDLHVCPKCYMLMRRSDRHEHDCAREAQRHQDAAAKFIGPHEPDIIF